MIQNLTILNIFKDDLEWLDRFITHHCEQFEKVIMLNTGNKETYEKAKTYQHSFKNLEIHYLEYEDTHFGNFRNDCLKLFEGETDHYCWVDTDEILLINTEEFKLTPSVQVGIIRRSDASGRFETNLERLFRKDVTGSWERRIHEGFSHRSQTIPLKDCYIRHLTSEVDRSQSKKMLYYMLLTAELDEGFYCDDRRKQVFALQHLIPMASHDLKRPDLTISVFEQNKELIMNLEPYEISSLQYVNLLIHTIMSYSRLHQNIDPALVFKIIDLDCTKSTIFQVMRALVFNPATHDLIKQFYETRYTELIDENELFNNKDYLIEREIEWFERKLYE